MPRANRVAPDGTLLAVPDRGLFWGNRGCLVDDAGQLVRWSSGRVWIICLLEFRGRKRVQWQPRRLTELYFLDEATGLAAGHRPCGECRNRDYRAFKAAWGRAHPQDAPAVAAIDARMHADRLLARGVLRTWSDASGALPDGAMVRHEGTARLVLGNRLRAWTPGGYADSIPYQAGEELEVLTPRCTVATLAAGYRPVLHPSVR